MLAGAVCGRVFASPSLQQIKRTLEWLIQEQQGVEILVIIKNYTGDLINFNSAVQMTLAQYKDSHQLNIKVLQVGDDAALLEQKGQMMPRGVAGTSLLYKILGAQGFEGASLDEVHAQGEKILANMWTFGVSMDSCSLPGKAKSHELEAD